MRWPASSRRMGGSWCPAGRNRKSPVRCARRSARIVVEDLPGTPVPDRCWGEPGLSRPERIYMWSSVIVLASITGQPEAPVNAVSGTAHARIQIRHTVDVPAETLVPNLRAHLDTQGLQMVEIVPVVERDMFLASR